MIGPFPSPVLSFINGFFRSEMPMYPLRVSAWLGPSLRPADVVPRGGSNKRSFPALFFFFFPRLFPIPAKVGYFLL